MFILLFQKLKSNPIFFTKTDPSVAWKIKTSSYEIESAVGSNLHICRFPGELDAKKLKLCSKWLKSSSKWLTAINPSTEQDKVQ